MSRNFRTRIMEMSQDENILKKSLVLGLSEFFGTAILVFLGCMGCVGDASHLQITLNFGLSVMIVIQIFGHISHAHVNPAITVGSVILGKKSIYDALIYILCQSGGSILGYGMLMMVTPHNFLPQMAKSTSIAATSTSTVADGNDFCVTQLKGNISVFQGLLVEGIATAVLMLIACAVWDKRNEKNTDSVAIKFGLAVTALATAAGPYTSCSMNPARSLGPAIWNNNWSGQWIYWIGPIGGSILASFMYKTIFGKEHEDCCSDISIKEEEPEAVKLNSIETDKI